MTQLPLNQIEDANDPPVPPVFARAERVLLGLIIIALVCWLLTGFYQIKNNQVGVVERLGQYLSNEDGKIIEVGSGLHYGFPWPIDRLHIISNQQTLTLKVDNFNTSPAANADFRMEMTREGLDSRVISAIFDPYLITADKSIVNMEISFYYQIDDPTLWLTTVSHESDEAGEPNDMREQIFQQLAQRAMIHLVSHVPLEDLMFDKRGDIPQMLYNELEEDMQINDPADPTGTKKLSLGIHMAQKPDVSQLRIPTNVQDAFDLVAQNRQQRQTAIDAAESAATALKTQANGDVDVLKSQAETYATRAIESAHAEVNRFQQVLTQYHNAPDMTRWNLFVETARTVSAAAKRIIIAQPGQKTFITVDPPKYDAGQVQTKP